MQRKVKVEVMENQLVGALEVSAPEQVRAYVSVELERAVLQPGRRKGLC